MTTQPQDLTPDSLVPTLRLLFHQVGDVEYSGEAVTLSEHMLQCAQLAHQNGDDEETIIAALLHDIGHLTEEYGGFTMKDSEDRFHENAGATLFAGLLPPRVIDCIRHHVSAKRYLCAVDSDYFSCLSEASVHSLNLQGGPMNTKESGKFAREPYLEDILKVRRYDDRAKVAGLDTADFEYYAPMLESVLTRWRALNRSTLKTE